MEISPIAAATANCKLLQTHEGYGGYVGTWYPPYPSYPWYPSYPVAPVHSAQCTVPQKLYFNANCMMRGSPLVFVTRPAVALSTVTFGLAQFT